MSAPLASPSAAELLPVADAAGVRRWVWQAMAHQWGRLVVAVLAMVATAAVGLAVPITIGWITQDVVDHRSTSALIGPVIVLVGAAVLAGVTSFGAQVLLARAVLPEVARLRERVLSTALTAPIEAVERGGQGDLVARVSGDTERVTEAAETALGSFIGAALTVLVTLAGLATLDWRFALAGLLAVPIQARTLRWYLRESRPIYAAGRTAEGQRASTLLGLFTALPTVRAYRLGPLAQEGIEQGSLAAMDYEFRATRAATRFYGRLNGAEFVGLGAILLVGYVLVHDHQVTVGAATTAALFFAGLFNPINTVLGVFDSIQQASAALARLIGITATAAPPSAPQPVPGPPLALAARGVSFAYAGGPDVLHDVDLILAPGQQVAIVGTTGSGKSTLAALLAGVREPRAGAITLGGVRLGDLDASQLHQSVALVTQDSHVFAGTVADNLRLGRATATADEIAGALSETGAASWVALLPDGVGTVIGPTGHSVTASQAQQLALARLLLLDPAIVILDEATAEAGSEAAEVLDAAARRVVAGRTAVLIAHRLSQAATADRVLVMDHGVIVESGTHQELIGRGGVYANLWSAWSGR